MKPGEPLYDRFGAGVESSTPQIFSYEQIRLLNAALLSYAREECSTVGMPRLGHYNIALQREMNTEGVGLPSGKIYRTTSYEDFSVGATPNQKTPNMTVDYENRLLIQTSDKDKNKGRWSNFIDVIDGVASHKGAFIVFGLVAPKDTAAITSVDSITYAVVQTSSGESFGFTFGKNPNIGKVIPSEGMIDEWGADRGSTGYIDKCSVVAKPLDNETMTLVRLELEKAKDVLVDGPEVESRVTNSKPKNPRGLGRSILDKVGMTSKPSTVGSSR